MQEKILGIDVGSNSIGWALLKQENKKICGIIDLGSRIFIKAVKEKPPTPKNVKRRDSRLQRRLIQRCARRRSKMLNYLVSINLLPAEIQENTQPEIILNSLGCPYELRTKALDNKLSPYEFGRILLHFSARRGFLSSKKQIAGDLIDDPDTNELLKIADKPKDKEEGQFKADISQLYQKITDNNARTLGEYLFNLEKHAVKRNRNHDGGHLRTERAMYKNELKQIWNKQQQYFTKLPKNFITEIEKIIFYQRPLKFKKYTIGKCSIETKHYRANIARLEVQKFRYLQDINNLKIQEKNALYPLNNQQKEKLAIFFEQNDKINITKIKKILELGKSTKINLEDKNIKGNITASKIRSVIGDIWNNYDATQQHNLFEDLFTIKKKSALKKRLIQHWNFDTEIAIKLCLLEFEPGHANLSLKAIKKILPNMQKGMRYDEAKAIVYNDIKTTANDNQLDLLDAPTPTSNPIVNKGMHELKRLINNIIKEYGKPDIIRIEMARDLEMNTKRYKNAIKVQKQNQAANEKAQELFLSLNLGKQYASREDKIRYRLWCDQNKKCAYSGSYIGQEQVFSAECEIDHILPFSKSLDDSYMNKVLCFSKENQNKGNKTPIDAWESDNHKWQNITQSIQNWDKSLKNKISRFYTTEEDLAERDFASSQLNDTRYIAKLAKDYVKKLGCQVNVTKGSVVSEIRHQWGFNSILGSSDKKDRKDHRHHAIDAVVIASTSNSLYMEAVKQIKQNKITIAPVYNNIREELAEKLKHIIVSHNVQRKITDELHEATGSGYVKKHNALIYRKTINKDITEAQIKKIVDKTVKAKVMEHIEKYQDIKTAFNEVNIKQLKIGKNPIKRVRIIQSNANEKKLASTKFAIKDKAGKTFKYMTYGNIHHIEIVKNIHKNNLEMLYVTMMQASHRVKGIGVKSQNMIKTNHGKDYEFVMALHKNDTVSIIKNNNTREFYRVQKFEINNTNTLFLRLNTAATLNNKDEAILLSINKLLDEFQLKKHRINAIGHFIEDD